jgi:HSP20 family protein
MKRERHTAWPLETVWNQDLVDSAFRDMLHNFFGGTGVFDRLVEGATHMMRVEEFIEGDECVIRAELPDIDPRKNIELTVADGVLHLSAKREERTEEERPDGYRSEFRYGLLTRDLRLPEGATEADVKATYKDGILEVRVPAPKPSEPEAAKKIEISRA